MIIFNSQPPGIRGEGEKMNENFFEWLGRKYGFWKEYFEQLEKEDPDFAEKLVKEYCSIASSY